MEIWFHSAFQKGQTLKWPSNLSEIGIEPMKWEYCETHKCIELIDWANKYAKCADRKRDCFSYLKSYLLKCSFRTIKIVRYFWEMNGGYCIQQWSYSISN